MTARIVLAGGGLANSLIAYRLQATRPEVEFVLLEREDTLGGNHTWSFHDADLTAEQHAWIRPLVTKSWSHHEVRFPELERRIGSGYHMITSSRLQRVVGEALGDRVMTGVEIAETATREVRLVDGTTIEADCVIDGRGDPGSDSLTLAYQKFLGRVLQLEEDHGLDGPILMDATVEQRDGFRFLYTLPFEPRELLVEDTRYSDSPVLAREEMREEVLAYARSRGWRVREAEREEEGVLPIVLAGDIDAFWREGPSGVARSGMRAALFHPTTGYSFPEAVRLAHDIAGRAGLEGQELYRWIRERSVRLWRRNGYFRLLNRMLFRAAAPERRYAVLQRFYRLPEPLIRRFYSGQPSLADRVRILTGKPPVPLGSALRCLFDAERRPGKETTP